MTDQSAVNVEQIINNRTFNTKNSDNLSLINVVSEWLLPKEEIGFYTLWFGFNSD